MLHQNGEEGEVHGGNTAPCGSRLVADVIVVGSKEVPHHLYGRFTYLVAPGNSSGGEETKKKGGGEGRGRVGRGGEGRGEIINLCDVLSTQIVRQFSAENTTNWSS